MPSIADPGAFALVGMGAFYGGIAHAPLAALVMVCEIAGSYDLLVPLMLTVGLAYLALRPVSLYSAQRASRSTGEGCRSFAADPWRSVADTSLQQRPSHFDNSGVALHRPRTFPTFSHFFRRELPTSTTVELLQCGTSSAIPLKRWVLRTRPLHDQSRYYPNYVGLSPKPKIASRFSSTSIQWN